MDSAREYLASGVRLVSEAAYRSIWSWVLVLFALTLVFLWASGISAPSTAGLTAVVVVQGAAGAIAWRLLFHHRSISILELIGAGLALGTVASMLAGLLWQWWLFPAAIAIGWLTWGRHRDWASISPLDRPSLVALALGVASGLATLVVSLRSYPLDWSGVWSRYHGDMAFFEALSHSVPQFGPTSSIFMSGADLRYHSLAYGWVGQVSETVDAGPFVVLTRVLPLVTIIGIVTLAAGWARRLHPHPWVPTIAVLLITVGGFIGATFGGVINFDSPSQTLTTLWLLLFSYLVLTGLDRGNLPWVGLAVAAVSFAMAGGKVSTAAVAVGGIVVMTIALAVTRSPLIRRAAVLTALTLVSVGAAYFLLIDGSANSGGLGLLQLTDRASSVQGLNPVITPRGILAGIVVLVLAVIPRWLGVAWLAGDPRTRWKASTWLGLGLVATGVITIVVLSGGFNDLWFAVAASAPLAVLSAAGFGAAATWLDDHRTLVLATAGGALVAVVAALLWSTGSTGVIGQGWRWAASASAWGLALVIAALLTLRGKWSRLKGMAALTVVVLVVAAVPSRVMYALAQPLVPPSNQAFSTVLFTPLDPFVEMIDKRQSGIGSDELAAGKWLRDNAEAGEVVATNRTADAIVPALSRMPTFVSNIHIQAPYGQASDVPEIQLREQQSWTFVSDPSNESFKPLCSAGVRWLWVDRSRSNKESWEPFATVVWESPTVVLAKINEAECP